MVPIRWLSSPLLPRRPVQLAALSLLPPCSQGPQRLGGQRGWCSRPEFSFSATATYSAAQRKPCDSQATPIALGKKVSRTSSTGPIELRASVCFGRVGKVTRASRALPLRRKC